MGLEILLGRCMGKNSCDSPPEIETKRNTQTEDFAKLVWSNLTDKERDSLVKRYKKDCGFRISETVIYWNPTYVLNKYTNYLN